MHDLLHDPLIGIRTPGGPRSVSLPELIGLLAAGEVDGYTGLRAHQADPLRVFLIQLAASVLARMPQATPPPNTDYWRDGLLSLAEGISSAWHVVEDDVTRPAFLQHPWTGWDDEASSHGVTVSRGRQVLKPKARTPDELDVLVTSKNHDVKASRVGASEIEGWVFALLMYQTMSGFLGAGNYGVVRMNGGFGSRPVVAWVSDLHPSRRFMEELETVRSCRAALLANGRYGYRSDGHVLTWLHAWRRSDHQYTLEDLDPCFVEACRPVRLRFDEAGDLCALGATSDARQIGPKTLESGDIGDPWIPLNVTDKKKGSSALTVAADGFGPRRVTELLFEDGYELTALQKPRPGETPGWFVATVLVRGQGKTEGFHSLELPIPAKARMTFSKPKGDPARVRLGESARNMITDAKDAAAALRTALTVLVEGGPDQPDFDRDAVKRWIEAVTRDYSLRWSQHFYPTLWRACEESAGDVALAWRRWLANTVLDLLETAQTRVPSPSNRRWRAITESRSALIGALRKKKLWPETTAPEEEVA